MVALMFCGLALAAPCTVLSAQSAEEILAKMDQKMDRADTDGCYFVMELKVPIIGALPAEVYMLHNNIRIQTSVGSSHVIEWTDGTTQWEYESDKNQVTIKQDTKLKTENDADAKLGLFDAAAEGYDLKIDKETDKAWNILCTKSKSNKNKDDPKKMELVVAKGSYLPISLKTSVNGVAITLRDVRIGVKEAEVTFDEKDYPGVKIIDKR